MRIACSSSSGIFAVEDSILLDADWIGTETPVSIRNGTGRSSATISSHYTARPVNMAVLYCIKAVESTSGGNSSGEVYSTEETRVGTWIDGKPLYRKVFQGTTGTSGQTKSIGVIPNLGNLIKLFGTVRASSNNFIALSFAQGGSYTTLGVNLNSNTVYLLSNSPTHLNSPVIVIAEYTKTTDQAAASARVPAAEKNVNLALGMATVPAVSMPVTSAVYNQDEEE